MNKLKPWKNVEAFTFTGVFHNPMTSHPPTPQKQDERAWKKEFRKQFTYQHPIDSEGFIVVASGKTKNGWTVYTSSQIEDFISNLLSSATQQAVQEERKKYEELIMAVGNKYPGETRHETALRYIKQAEMSSGVASESLSPSKEGGKDL